MKLNFALVCSMVVSFGSVVGGCSGGKKYSFTCDIDTSTTNTCTQYEVPTSQEGNATEVCKGAGGTVTFDKCSRPGYLGTCTTSSNGVDAVTYEYPSSQTETLNGAQTACQNAGGKFKGSITGVTGTNDGGTQPPGGSVFSCNCSGICLQFTATTSQAQSDASSECAAEASDGCGALEAGSCSTSGVEGVCTVPDAEFGAGIEEFISTAAGQGAATDEESCTEDGGTWTNG